MSNILNLQETLRFLLINIKEYAPNTLQYKEHSLAIYYVNLHLNHLLAIFDGQHPTIQYIHNPIIHLMKTIAYMSVVQKMLVPNSNEWKLLMFTTHVLYKHYKSYDLSTLTEDEFLFYLMIK